MSDSVCEASRFQIFRSQVWIVPSAIFLYKNKTVLQLPTVTLDKLLPLFSLITFYFLFHNKGAYMHCFQLEISFLLNCHIKMV